jgi:hypothetical protein
MRAWIVEVYCRDRAHVNYSDGGEVSGIGWCDRVKVLVIAETVEQAVAAVRLQKLDEGESYEEIVSVTQVAADDIITERGERVEKSAA